MNTFVTSRPFKRHVVRHSIFMAPCSRCSRVRFEIFSIIFENASGRMSEDVRMCRLTGWIRQILFQAKYEQEVTF